METFCWILSLVTCSLHSLVDCANPHSLTTSIVNHFSRPTTPEDRLHGIKTTKEVINDLTQSLIDDLVEQTVEHIEDRNEIVQSVVMDLVESFLDVKSHQEATKTTKTTNSQSMHSSTFGGRSPQEPLLSLDEELMVKDVVHELMDGIVDTLGEIPPARMVVDCRAHPDVGERVVHCEMVIMSINRLLEVYYHKLSLSLSLTIIIINNHH